MIEDIAAKVDVKADTVDQFKSLDDEFEAIEQIKRKAKQDQAKQFQGDMPGVDAKLADNKIECMESLVAKVNQVEDGDATQLQMSSSPKKSD